MKRLLLIPLIAAAAWAAPSNRILNLPTATNLTSVVVPVDGPLGTQSVPLTTLASWLPGHSIDVTSAAFGAVGDGVTDDTAALQSALKWQQTNLTKGAAIYLPSGRTYLLSTTLTATNPLIITSDAVAPQYQGSGVAASSYGAVIKYTGTGNAISVTGPNNRIEHLGLITTTSTNSAAILATGCVESVFADLYFSSWGYAFYISGGNNNSYSKIWDAGSYITGFFATNSGTANRVADMYLQRAQRIGQSYPTVSITNVTLTSGTNLTIGFSGSLPSYVGNNTPAYISGVTVSPVTAWGGSGSQTFGFITSLTTTNFVINLPSTASSATLGTGLVTFNNFAGAGPWLQLTGGGEWDIQTLDVEQGIGPAPAISAAANALHVGTLHLEGVQQTSSISDNFIVNFGNILTVDNCEVVNCGLTPNALNSVLLNQTAQNTGSGASYGAVGTISKLVVRDVCGTNFVPGWAANLGVSPTIGAISTGGTIRANGSPTFVSGGYYSGVVAPGTGSVIDLNAQLYGGVTLFTSGTNLTVSSGYLYDLAGTPIPIVGSTLSLPPGTYYIKADLRDGTVHAWLADRDMASVRIANVTATTFAVTVNNRYPLQLPTTALPKTLSKLRAGLAVTGVFLGDSILNGAYSTNNGAIKYLLFNSGSNSGTNFNVYDASNVTINDWTLGGSQAAYGALLCGEIVGEPAIGLDYIDTVHSLTGYTAALNGITTQPLGDSPTLAGVDFAVIAYVVNGGQEFLAYTEMMVRRLRERGVEVILLTGNPTINTTYFGDVGNYLYQLGQSLGCQVCDTWCNFYEAETVYGASVYGDANLHPNNLGYTKYAVPIDAALNTSYILPVASSGAPLPRRNFFAGVQPTNNTAYPTYGTPSQFPSVIDSIFKFANTTGSSSNTQSASLNTAVVMGAKSSGAGVLILTNGQYAMFHHPAAKCLWVLRENDGSNPTYQISINNNGTYLYTNAISDASTTVRIDEPLTLGTASNVGMENVLPAANYNFTGSGFAGEGTYYRPFGGRITCTSGTLKLVGVAFGSDEHEAIPYESCRLTGTWSEEAGIQGYSVTKYTATSNSAITIPFKSAGVMVSLSTRTNAGTISWQMDGNQISSGVNYYHTGSFTVNQFFFANPANTATQDTGTPAQHFLTGTLVGFTNSGSANEPLAIYDIWAIRPR